MPQISVAPKGSHHARYKLLGKTSRDERWTYREVVQPVAQWDHGTRTYQGKLEDFPRFVDRCIEQGFDIKPSPELLDVLTTLRDDLVKEARALDASLRVSKLFPYQREGVAFLAGRSHAGLFDEMGLGKTVQAIMAIPNVAPKTIAPTIICAPASLKGVWKKELNKWRPDVKNIFIANGRDSFFPPGPGEVLICNYAILPSYEDCEELIEEELIQPGTILIGDEIHRAKNPKANRTKAWRRLVSIIEKRAGAVWGLSGTPLLNNGRELKEVTKSIGVFAEAFGTEKSFGRMFEAKDKWANPPVPDYFRPFPEVAKRLATVAIRRERKEVLTQLPDKLYRNVDADPPTGEAAEICDRALGDELVMEALRVLEKGGETSFGGMGALMEARRCLATCKIPKLLEIADEYEDNGVPLIVFSAHRAPIDTLARREGWITITGNTPNHRRTEIESNFQAGKYKGIAGTISAMSEGLTLTHSHHVVFVDLDWTPARNQQAEDRACRIGQDKGVNIIRLVADHELDCMITDLLVRKAEAFDRSIRRMAHFKTEVDIPTGEGSPLSKKASELDRIIRMLEKFYGKKNTTNCESDSDMSIARAKHKPGRSILSANT